MNPELQFTTGTAKKDLKKSNSKLVKQAILNLSTFNKNPVIDITRDVVYDYVMEHYKEFRDRVAYLPPSRHVRGGVVTWDSAKKQVLDGISGNLCSFASSGYLIQLDKTEGPDAVYRLYVQGYTVPEGWTHCKPRKEKESKVPPTPRAPFQIEKRVGELKVSDPDNWDEIVPVKGLVCA